jgi:hypothetical protein
MPALHLPARLKITVVGKVPVERKSSGRRIGRGTVFVLGIAAALLYLHLAAEPRITLSARSLQFAPTTKGTTSDSVSFLVTNSGSEFLHVGALELRDEASADFAITSDCSGSTLAPQHSCTVSVAMTPSVAGERRAELVVPNDSDERTPFVTLAGDGRVPAVPDITPTPPSLRFDQPVNISSTMSILISNTGAVPVDIAAVTLSAPDQFNRSSGCEHTTLAVNGTCSFEVTYVPTQEGQSTGEVRIDYASGRALTIPITATTEVPPSTTPPTQPEMQGRSNVDPKSLVYRQELGKASGTQVVTVKNIGEGPIRVVEATITKGANDFAVRNLCQSEIAPGKSCTLEVNFVGNAASRSEGTLVISTTDETFPVTLIAEVVTVGTAIADVNPKRLVLVLAPAAASSSLAALFLGQRDVVSVRNTGNAPLEFTKFGFEPEGEFSMSTAGLKAPCGKRPIASGAMCEIRIIFHPHDGGGRGTFLIFDNAENNPQRVALYGQTPKPARGQLQVDSYNHDFGSVPVGTYSVGGVRIATATPSQRIVMRNVGSGNLTISAVHQPSDRSYAVRPDCPRPLAPSATCVLLVIFRPTTVGSHPASVEIDDDGSSGNATLSFQGEGVNPYSRLRVSRVPPASTPVPR